MAGVDVQTSGGDQVHYSGLIIGPDIDGQMARYSEDRDVEPYIAECGECCGEARYQPCDKCDNTDKALTTRNPDGQWDYWRIGGRYRGLLCLLPGAPGGLADQSWEWDDHPDAPDWAGRADFAPAGSVDWERTIAEMGDYRTYFMLAEGAWKAKERYDSHAEPAFISDPNYQHLWDLTVRGLDPTVVVTIVDIHS